MNDISMSIVAIVVATVILLGLPLLSTADRADDLSQQAVQAATTEFVDNVRSTGRITSDKYDNFISTITQTGNSFSVLVEAKILDENARKKVQQASSSKVGENEYYSEFTAQIEDKLGKTGVYNLKEGDIISVTVKNTNRTMSQILRNLFYSVTTGNNTNNIAAQHSGIVNVNAKN